MAGNEYITVNFCDAGLSGHVSIAVNGVVYEQQYVGDVGLFKGSSAGLSFSAPVGPSDGFIEDKVFRCKTCKNRFIFCNPGSS